MDAHPDSYISAFDHRRESEPEHEPRRIKDSALPFGIDPGSCEMEEQVADARQSHGQMQYLLVEMARLREQLSRGVRVADDATSVIESQPPEYEIGISGPLPELVNGHQGALRVEEDAVQRPSKR